jgi:hypothetical protein
MLLRNPRTLEVALCDLIERRQTAFSLADRTLLDRMIGDLENEISLRCSAGRSTELKIYHWTAPRKRALLAAIDRGEATVEEACQRYNMLAEELESWRSGRLYVTKCQPGRLPRRRRRKDPPAHFN